MFDMVLNTPLLNTEVSLANFCHVDWLLKNKSGQKMDNNFV